jgi:NTP pyrophosphatase (non-canonical NTP hydrolase)
MTKNKNKLLTVEENDLTFKTLRHANIHRLPTFKNSQGGRAHQKDDGSDWIPAQWLQATVGELGEFANIRKKFERGDITFEQYKKEAAKELADIQIYLDLLAMRCLDHGDYVDPEGIDLAKATLDKFNEVSDRVGSPIYICSDGLGLDIMY